LVRFPCRIFRNHLNQMKSNQNWFQNSWESFTANGWKNTDPFTEVGVDHAPSFAFHLPNWWRCASQLHLRVDIINYCYFVQPILASQKLITKGKEYSYLSKWLGACMFLTTGKYYIEWGPNNNIYDAIWKRADNDQLFFFQI
jgi:hypothetical protein